MSQRLLETDFPSSAYKPQVRRSSSRERPPNLSLRPVSTSGGTMPKNYSSSASEWQYEPSLMTTSRTGSMSRVQTSFAVKQPQHTEAIVTRTGSLRKAFTSTTSDEDEEETRPLHRPHNNHNNTVTSSTTSKTHGNNSQSSTSDYHSDENPNLLPVEHRELPSFRLNQLHR